MKLFKLYLLILIQCLCFNSISAHNYNDSITVEKIINNAVLALGGKEYLQTIKTLYSDVSTEMEGRQVHWIIKEMLPNKGSFQISYNNRTVYQNWFDGKKGFEIINGEKKKADPDEFKDKKYKRNIFDELDYLDPSLWTLTLTGEEKVNNEDCYKIKATLVNGATSIFYYSKTSFQRLRVDKISKAEKDTFETTYFGGFTKFEGLTFYTEMKFEDNGKIQTAKIVKLLINEMVAESDFK